MIRRVRRNLAERRDSNPGGLSATAVFKAALFDRSRTTPKITTFLLQCCAFAGWVRLRGAVDVSLQLFEPKRTGGEGGIRTPDTGVSPYNGLANRRLQPLGHLSVR